jgi:hypothetical protein
MLVSVGSVVPLLTRRLSGLIWWRTSCPNSMYGRRHWGVQRYRLDVASLLIIFGCRITFMVVGKSELRVSLRLLVVFVVVKCSRSLTWKRVTLKVGEGKIDWSVEVTGIQGRRRKQQRGNLKNKLMRCIVDMVRDNARGWQHSPEACSVCVCVCVLCEYPQIHTFCY